MTEAMHHEGPKFPEIGENSELSQDFWNECDTLKELWEKSLGDYEFESKLPQVVGYVPDNERALFDTLSHLDINDEEKKFHGMNLEQLQQAFPGIWSEISRDLARVGVTGYEERGHVNADIRRAFVLAGHFADGNLRGPNKPNLLRPDGDWHLDNPTRNFSISEGKLSPVGTPSDLIYVVRNVNPTLFYEGPSVLCVKDFGNNDPRYAHRSIYLKGPEVPGDGLVVPAPKYGIVRMGPLSPHSTSVFPTDDTSTFLRVHITPQRDVWTLRP